MNDLIIVGTGLAAHVVALQSEFNGLRTVIIGTPELSASSWVAAGLWNPVVFKRMTRSWKAEVLLPELKDFYTKAEVLLNEHFYTERKIIKPFFSPEERNIWIKRAKAELSTFLEESTYTATEEHKGLLIPNEYGVVNHCGNIQMNDFLKASIAFFKNKGAFMEETFDHSQLVTEGESISYKGIRAKHIVFCEGHMVKNNPYFKWIPLKPVKGEVLTLKSDTIDLKTYVLNHDAFMLKQNDWSYKLGATYDWNDLNDSPSQHGLVALISKLSKLITADYSIVKHEAGVRPSSIDRRPIIGSHPLYKNMHVFNGLGTKGVMLAPYFAKNFVHFLMKKETLHTESDVMRFYHLHTNEHQN